MLAALTLVLTSAGFADDVPIARIAFGSCCNEELPQPIWQPIVTAQPQLFLFLGDNVYADTTDMKEMRMAYSKLDAQPGYQALKKTCPILAVWDDHDFGKNDAGKEYPKKDHSQRELLAFFEEPADSPRWNRKGVYQAQSFGPADKRVQVIMLDTRYFRSRLSSRRDKDGNRLPNNNPNATILGKAQWAWLGEQLREPATIRILASSIQVLADEHHHERWANFPHEQARLFDLLRKTQVTGLIMLSGDRHMAELSRAEGILSYPLYDLTSSSLNRPRNPGNPNRYRIGDPFPVANFGLITIDWAQADPSIRLEIRGDDGRELLSHQLTLGELR